jgi:hypothetical protein
MMGELSINVVDCLSSVKENTCMILILPRYSRSNSRTSYPQIYIKKKSHMTFHYKLLSRLNIHNYLKTIHIVHSLYKKTDYLVKTTCLLRDMNIHYCIHKTSHRSSAHVTLHRMLFLCFYKAGKVVYHLHQPTLHDYHFTAPCDCLFYIFASTLHI